MPVAISYRRFSSLGKQAKGDSTDRQAEKFDRALKELKQYDLEPGEVYFDKGKSGYHGRHKKGELGRILANLKLFPKDAWLIIESFSRLTRQGIGETQELIRQIVKGGLTLYIVDHRLILDRAALEELGPVVIVAVEAYRAWQASKEKSDWGKECWKRKIAKATAERPATHHVPNWIQAVGKDENRKFVLIPERQSIIRELVRMRLEGQGEYTLWRWLVNNHKPWYAKSKSGKPRWGTCTVNHILRNRALMGDWVRKDGSVNKGYYPAILTSEEFDELQATYVRAERFRGGEVGKMVTNLFQGLAFDTKGNSMILHTGGKDRRCKRLISSGGNPEGFRYSVFEEVFLEFVEGLTLNDIGRTIESSAELDAVEREIYQTEAHYLDIKKALSDLGGNVVALAAQALASENRLKVLAGKRDKLKAAQHLSTAEQSLADCRTIRQGLAKLKGDDLYNARMRLRSAIRGLVRGVVMIVERDGWATTLVSRIVFHSGQYRDLYIKIRRGWDKPIVKYDGQMFAHLNGEWLDRVGLQKAAG